jgi:hypothetical protein
MDGMPMGKGSTVVFVQDYRLCLGDWEYVNIKKGTEATVTDTTHGWAPWNNDWKHEWCNLRIPTADPNCPNREFTQIPMSFVCPNNPVDLMLEELTREERRSPLEKAVRALDEEIKRRVKAERKAKCSERPHRKKTSKRATGSR